MASRLRAAALRAALGPLLIASLAGCVSMQSGGPVLSYSITQSPGGQNQAFIQRIAQPPQPQWSPSQIVEGFITASGSLGLQTAREYLTPKYSKQWNPAGWSATVYSKGPYVGQPSSTPKKNPRARTRHPQTAVVMVSGTVKANVIGSSGNYVFASAKSPKPPNLHFNLVKLPGGLWRISQAPRRLLLTSSTFRLDYQQRNLYFFDPTTRQFLVPDPVYVPLYATPAELMHNLVNDLNAGPAPGSWLAGATDTAFASLPGAKVGDVTLDGGTATVALTTTSKRPPTTVLQQIYAQLYWTLLGSGQGSPAVQTVNLSVNGKALSSPGTQQPAAGTPAYQPPSAETGVFYYLDSAGYLVQQNGAQGAPHRIGSSLGKGFTQIAVSPPVGGGSMQYLAALRTGAKGGDTLYTGLVGGKLVKRGTGYTSMSWAPDGYLWTTTAGGQIARLRGNASPAKPAGQPQPVTVLNVTGSFTAIRVAPDGVRVALIGGSVLSFGAINHLAVVRASEQSIQITPSPYNVAVPGTTLTTVTWFGPDNVITLGTLGAGRRVLTEYAVNGGGSASIPPPPRVQTITAAGAGHSLIAGVAKSGVWSDASLTGAWAPVILNPNSANSVQLKGASPVYPG
jgi:lipoprotein LpqB-like beta-propeller protein/sporulation and spore germination protein